MPAKEQVTDGSQTRKRLLAAFTGGLVNVPDLTSLADNELAQLQNLEVDLNGGLTSRPPIVKWLDSSSTTPPKVLGYFTDAAGKIWLVTAISTGTYLLDTSNAAAAAVLVDSGQATGAAQYGGLLYLCFADKSGGYWNGTSFTQLGTGDLKMPRGEQIVLWKSRFWMLSREATTNRTRIFFSNLTAAGSSPTSINEWNVWGTGGQTGNSFFDVSAGDGQWITKLLPGTAELFVFRNASTWVFKYDASPLQGRLDQLDSNIGADNQWSVDRFEFSYVVLSNGRLYRFVSYTYYPLNDPQKMQFLPTATSADMWLTSAVSVFGRRALVWYGGKMYALDLTLNTWSTWEHAGDLGYLLRTPRRENDLAPDTAFGVSANSADGVGATWGWYRIVDRYDATNKEEMTCIVQTKAYDFDFPADWKRMFYWSADVLTARDVTGIAQSFELASVLPSWDDLEAYSWDALEAGSWDAPTVKTGIVTTDRDYPGLNPYRVNVYFDRDMRFRRCTYTVSLSTDGSTGTGPVRLVSLSVHAVTKQRLAQVVQ